MNQVAQRRVARRVDEHNSPPKTMNAGGLTVTTGSFHSARATETQNSAQRPYLTRLARGRRPSTGKYEA